ncbi:MAG: ABC transporter [Magnetovibrio sp.]|nr:ABC transporter [Magnetovibrio sp.]|tara:strand:+ start:307 stop:1017 length:711 start_codon:yes stop_codon:yes gene_type:complete
MNELNGDETTRGQPVLSLEKVERSFRQGRQNLKILKDISLSVRAGEIVALVGPSGAGKSTLLHISGLLESPDAGSITICGEACANLADDERTSVRRRHLGFVYQHHHLLPEFTALENIVIPQIIAGHDNSDAQDRAREILTWLGLAERETHRPARLSGGEQQRVAIGRAIATGPNLLLADEPTGNLDPQTADEVFDMLLRLARGANLAAVIATHNPGLASRMDRIARLEDGHLVEI